MKKFGYGPLALSFWIPFASLLLYFVYRHMAPFGSSTILTVDLGQQYLDYFAQFKTTILHDPSSFFYSFSSGLGGDMIGEWSYYLMSPFNLFFLLADAQSLPAWILLVTILKLATAGLTMGLFLKNSYHLKGYAITLFAINYPLSAWFVANALNLLWLDTAILLPLLLCTLHRLLKTGKTWPFIIVLIATILSNYYIAWMIALFLVLYLPIAYQQEDVALLPIKSLIKICLAGVTAIVATAWLWLPTLDQLTLGKTTHSANWTLGFENNPATLFFKLIPGSFDFSQMQTGQANFLVAPVVLFFLWPFFTKKNIRLSERVASLFALIVLLLATCWIPLVLLFHGGQYPVWYPARFSFLISFLLIVMAARGYDSDQALTNLARGFYLLATLTITVLGSFFMNQLSYLNKPELFTFLFGYLLTLLTLIFVTKKQIKQFLLLLITAVFLMANLALTLNHLSYLTNAEYQKGAKQVTMVNRHLEKDRSWYRVAEGIGRTYNDGFLGYFKAGSHFSSLLPASSSAFFRNMGQIAGDSKISYSNGTIITDSLLSFKYYLDQSQDASADRTQSLKRSFRPDYLQSASQSSGNGWRLVKNERALPVAYAASKEALSFKNQKRYPLQNQANLLKSLVGQSNQQILTQQPLEVSGSYNIQKLGQITGGSIVQIDHKQPSTLVLTFTPQTDGAYYLNLGGAFDLSGVTIIANGQRVTQQTGYDHSVALNVANNAKGQKQLLTFVFDKSVSNRYLDDLALYALDQDLVNQDLSELQQHPLNVEKSNSRYLKGTIQTTKAQPLIMTSIPSAPGWVAKVDGRVVPTKTVAGGLIAIPTTAGKHQITLSYMPPLFLPGLILSATFITVVAVVALFSGYKVRFSLARNRRP
ncbi:predicted membrane protein [Fructobacillus fructosus]|uniref:YfhO family protein n=1 Tax=Fructobacillus fructosus TaxID=1631 RepID=UPI0002194538|nr:YfhO family protein [Fructobacillus fructosus]KRN52209.1 hypothetical protein IV71_GL001474 [Fructobacillus fructosus KCTC 3544]GAP01570.1 predicted membrane protein [Fructobacillus fructosus]